MATEIPPPGRPSASEWCWDGWLNDPTRTTDGIDVTDTPILSVRRRVYEVSAVNRKAGWKSHAAAAAAAGAS